jgi:hypothetical protein
MEDMVVYAEWTDEYGIHIDFFHSWGEFHAATFSPDCEIKKIVALKK